MLYEINYYKNTVYKSKIKNDCGARDVQHLDLDNAGEEIIVTKEEDEEEVEDEAAMVEDEDEAITLMVMVMVTFLTTVVEEGETEEADDNKILDRMVTITVYLPMRDLTNRHCPNRTFTTCSQNDCSAN